MKPTIASIKAAVAAKHHFSVKAIENGGHHPRLVRSRHLAFYLARRLTDHSFPTIGRHFGGRHHTTIMNGYRKVQFRVHRNQKTRASVARFIDELTQ